jgi:2'-5' RNA ligase
MPNEAEQIRAFIAIEIPEEVKSFLSNLATSLKATSANVRWVRPEGMHLTLKFLGNIPKDLIPTLDQNLGPVFSRSEDIRLEVGRVGAFPHLRKPRVIWAGLEDKAGLLVPLVGKLEEQLAALGFKKENRPFSPHMTLGRVKSGKNISDLVEAVRNRSDIVGPSFTADHAILFRSILKPSGAEYHKLRRFDFIGQ